MAAIFRLSFNAAIEAPTPEGSATRQTYVVPSELYITADTNAIAQIELLPDDYVFGSSTSPVVSMDLEYGSPYIDFSVTAGGGTPAENVTCSVITGVDGVDPDFTELRAIAVRVLPVAAGTCKFRGSLVCGDLASPGLATIAIPLALDSTITDATTEASAVIAIPKGVTFASAKPLKLTIYESDNARVVILLMGK